MTDSEKMALATRLYVRLRHCTGRSTDALWMTRNADYGHEIVRLARVAGDDELVRLADRFAEHVLGIKPRPVPVAAMAVEGGDVALDEASMPLLQGKYTGSLR